MVLDDKAAYELSLAIQPEKPSAKGHRKNDSYASNSSSEAIDGPLQRKVNQCPLHHFSYKVFV